MPSAYFCAFNYLKLHLNKLVHHSPPMSALLYHTFKAILSVECRSCNVLGTGSAV